MAVITESTRINATIRDAIIENALISSGVVEAERKQTEARAELLEDIVKLELDRIGETQASIRKKFNDLQKRNNEFIRVDVYHQSADPGCYAYVDVNLCGRRVYMYANGARASRTPTHLTEDNTPHLRPISEGGNFYPRGVVTITDQDIATRFDALEALVKKNSDDRANIKATVGATLKKYATIGKLLAAWPEVKDLLPKEYQTNTDVALSVDTLNAMCGLPK